MQRVGFFLLMMSLVLVGAVKAPAKNQQLEAINVRCMVAIVQSAYRNQASYTRDGVVLASHVYNCENLKSELKRMIATSELSTSSKRI